ncbi:hypothetical protein BDK51DRAFT_30542, partial [Blyttiomyces helicus]
MLADPTSPTCTAEPCPTCPSPRFPTQLHPLGFQRKTSRQGSRRGPLQSVYVGIELEKERDDPCYCVYVHDGFCAAMRCDPRGPHKQTSSVHNKTIAFPLVAFLHQPHIVGINHPSSNHPLTPNTQMNPAAIAAPLLPAKSSEKAPASTNCEPLIPTATANSCMLPFRAPRSWVAECGVSRIDFPMHSMKPKIDPPLPQPDEIRRMYLLHALVEVAEGALFATITEKCVTSEAVMEADPNHIWLILSMIPLLMWPLAMYAHRAFRAATTSTTALFWYLATLTIVGLVLLEHDMKLTNPAALSILYYIAKTEGVKLNPAPYLWYGTWVAGGLLVLVAVSDVHGVKGKWNV